MYTENFNLDAGNGQQWARDGMFRCIRYDEGAATGGVTPKIRITSVVGSAYDCELIPGRQITLPENARGIVVKNASGAASITGKITVGSGNISDNSIVGEVSLSAGALAALEQINVRPEAQSNHTNVVAILGATTAEQVFSPAANTAGVILQGATLSEYGGTPTSGGLLAKASAPTSLTDGVLVAHVMSLAPSTSNTHHGVSVQRDIFIPAGLGLYWFLSVAMSANCQRSVRWKAL